MGLQGEQNAEWLHRVSANLISGVSSQFRYWGDDDTLVIERGEGEFSTARAAPNALGEAMAER